MEISSRLCMVLVTPSCNGQRVYVNTPHGLLPRDSHEITPTIGGGTQVDDLTKGFSKGKVTKNIRLFQGSTQPYKRLSTVVGKNIASILGATFLARCS